MSQKPFFVLANFKMNMDTASLKKYFSNIKKIAKYTPLGFAIPYVYLANSKKIMRHTAVKIGAQDCSAFDKGAYTGQISAAMIEDVGCDFCIVGHSECRKRGDSNADIQHKLEKLKNTNISVILCIGESLEQRKNHTFDAFLLEQLQTVFSTFDANELERVMIAYEPIWAIGTGITPSMEDIQATILMIKRMIADHYPSPMMMPKVLYGGSVNQNNILDIKENTNADGVLVGGASLDIEEFQRMIKNVC